MLRNGENHCNNGAKNTDIQLPEESTLQAIAKAVVSSLEAGSKQSSSVVQIDNLSTKPHHSLKNTTILNFSAHLTSDKNVPISVLMKKTDGLSSVELQAYSTLFKDLQPHSTKNVYSILQGKQHENLYNLIPRLYLIQKPYLFLENLEHENSGEFKALQPSSYGRNKVTSFNLDFNHCLMAVETLARFHATSYILRNQLGIKGKGKLEMLQKYPFLNQQSTSQHYSTRMSSQLGPAFEQGFDLAIKAIQQENPSLAFKLQRKVLNPEGIFEKVVKLLEDEKYDNDDFYVVCHGNFLADSLLFSYEKSSGPNAEPMSCRITNFNSIFMGPLASDLAMLMLSCTSLEFRLEFEEKLLAYYCDAFQEQLVARCGVNSALVAEFNENIDEFHRKVEKQYKKMMEFAFYNICVLLPLKLFTSLGDCTDNNNKDGVHEAKECSSIKDLLEEGYVEKYFSKEKYNEFENFAIDNVTVREKLVEILKQFAKYRVLL